MFICTLPPTASSSPHIANSSHQVALGSTTKGALSSHTHLYNLPTSLPLEFGGELSHAQLCYTIIHATSEAAFATGGKVAWICHALTGSSEAHHWWSGLWDANGLFLGQKGWTVICANVLGSCYGSTGPLSLHPYTQRPYYQDFPLVSIRDMVLSQTHLAQHRGLSHIDLVLGGSLGGMQALEWGFQSQISIGRIATIAACAAASSWIQSWNEAQRLAIQTDPTWALRIDEAGKQGLEAARAIAMISYRSDTIVDATQSDNLNTSSASGGRAGSYLRHQGHKLAQRFNAFSYYRLTQAMDMHDLGRNRGGKEEALASVEIPILSLGMQGDLLFGNAQQVEIADLAPHALHQTIPTRYGHDGFLVEIHALVAHLDSFISHPSLN